jgi:hypothetical protein
VLTNCFFRCVAEYSLGALVPARDYSIQILADDCIIGGVHDSGEKTLRRIGCHRPLLNTFAGG